MSEIWKVIPDHAPYEISDLGRIRGFGSEKAQRNDGGGYRTVSLQGHIHRVHRLVLETFIGPCPHKMVACHNNGVRNDNRLCNLRWDTMSANVSDWERPEYKRTPLQERWYRQMQSDIASLTHTHSM